MKHKTDIKVQNLSKSFRISPLKKKWGVLDLSFTIEQGQVVGLLGPNGSGKSTTIKMMLGFLRPTQGTIEICGHSSRSNISRKFIGYLPENPKFQKFLSARSVLTYYGRLLDIPKPQLAKRIDYLLELVSLKDASAESSRGYSKGMTQRLAIAQSLLMEPRLLIFDEPMSGLDPLGRMHVRKIIRDIHLQMPQTTIFFSTHILGDVEELCTSVLLLKKGQLQEHCSIEELIKEQSQSFEVVVKDPPESLPSELTARTHPQPTPMGMALEIEGVAQLMADLELLKQVGAEVTGIYSRRQSLEQALFGDESSVEGTPGGAA